MAATLAERKTAAIEQLLAIDSARRGQLSVQYYARKTASGRTVRQGPYYVWQRYVKGQKRSVRVNRQQIDRVQEQLARGRQAQALFDELWSVLEQSATAEDPHAKKKSKPSKRLTTAKPRPRSI